MEIPTYTYKYDDYHNAKLDVLVYMSTAKLYEMIFIPSFLLRYIGMLYVIFDVGDLIGVHRASLRHAHRQDSLKSVLYHTIHLYIRRTFNRLPYNDEKKNETLFPKFQ